MAASAAPMAETLTSTWQAEAPLMHAQDLGAKDDLVLIDEPLGVSESQELQQSRVRASHRTDT